MVYEVFAYSTETYSFEVNPLDGYWDNLELEDYEHVLGDGVKPSAIGWCGLPYKSKNMPTKVHLGGHHREVREVIAGGTVYCGEQFKELIESFEPGVHQFFPMTFYWRNGEVAAEKYWFVPCNRLDTVSQEHSTAERRIIWMEHTGELVFSKAQIGNHQLWFDKFVPGNYRFFVSDALGKALIEANFSDLKVKERAECE